MTAENLITEVKSLSREDLNIPELNLTNPLYFGTIFKLRSRYNLDFEVYLPTKEVNLQRGFVWSLQQKQQLILSIFKQKFGSNNGIRLIPCFSAVQHEEFEVKTLQIIDGKQRLSTIFDFIDNKFPIEHRGDVYYFNDLSLKLKECIQTFPVEMVVKYSCPDDPVTDQDKIDWFETINFFGTPQDLEHLQKLK